MVTSSSTQPWEIESTLWTLGVSELCLLCVISQRGIQFWSSQKAEIQAWLSQSAGYFFICALSFVKDMQHHFLAQKNLPITSHVSVCRPACLASVSIYDWVDLFALRPSTPSRADERTEQVKWNQRTRFTKQIRRASAAGRISLKHLTGRWVSGVGVVL